MKRQWYHLLTRELYALAFNCNEHISNLFRRSDGNFPITTKYYPSGLGIEVTNICNANCIFCAYQYRERRAQTMDQKLFERIIDQYIEGGGGQRRSWSDSDRGGTFN